MDDLGRGNGSHGPLFSPYGNRQLSDKLAYWQSLVDAAEIARPDGWCLAPAETEAFIHGINYGDPDDPRGQTDLLEDPPLPVLAFFVAAREAIPDLIRRVRKAEAIPASHGDTPELARLRAACIAEENEIKQTLGKALGYPRFCDDLRNFPGATEADGVCVGEHVAATLAQEAAQKIGELQCQVNGLANRVADQSELLTRRAAKLPIDRIAAAMAASRHDAFSNEDARAILKRACAIAHGTVQREDFAAAAAEWLKEVLER